MRKIYKEWKEKKVALYQKWMFLVEHKFKIEAMSVRAQYDILENILIDIDITIGEGDNPQVTTTTNGETFVISETEGEPKVMKPASEEGIIINNGMVFIDGLQIDLTSLEFRLLSILYTHNNRLLSRANIIDLVWGDDYIPSTHDQRIDALVKRLRKKLTGQGNRLYIETCHGRGYMLNKTGQKRANKTMKPTNQEIGDTNK